jgi:hypothetical protein
MDGSRLIAWTIGLVVVAVGIAVIAGETTIVHHFTQLPTIPAHLGTLVSETKLIVWQVFSFAVLVFLLWAKLR